MDKTIITISVWVLFVGGLFGLAVGMVKLLTGGSPAEYGVMGIGGGFWLLSSAIAIYVREHLPR